MTTTVFRQSPARIESATGVSEFQVVEIEDADFRGFVPYAMQSTASEVRMIDEIAETICSRLDSPTWHSTMKGIAFRWSDMSAGITMPFLESLRHLEDPSFPASLAALRSALRLSSTWGSFDDPIVVQTEDVSAADLGVASDLLRPRGMIEVLPAYEDD